MPRVKRTTPPLDGRLARLTTLGGLLGIKTSALVPRLAPVLAATSEGRDSALIATVPHGFDALWITAKVARDAALAVCGPWLEALPGDHLTVEVGATSVRALSDEAALPGDVPALVGALGADGLAAIGHDGATWTYVFEQANADDAALEASLARIDRLASELGVTAAQRRVGANLHRSLSRRATSRLWLRARDGVVEPVVGLGWDRIEWAPIQSMLGGFYPAGGGVEKIARLARSSDALHATVELALGPTDPPALRFSFPAG